MGLFTTLKTTLTRTWIPILLLICIQMVMMSLAKEGGKCAAATSWYTKKDRFGQHIEAQNYIGTISIGDYTQKNVEAKLSMSQATGATVTLFDVKFAHMMPVKIDVSIPGLSLEETRLTGDNIIPLSKGKEHRKHLIRRLKGTADASRLSFSCMMGKKQLIFNGTRKK